jgi:hypothetical protein
LIQGATSGRMCYEGVVQHRVTLSQRDAPPALSSNLLLYKQQLPLMMHGSRRFECYLVTWVCEPRRYER